MTEASGIYAKLAQKYNLTEEQIRTVIIYFWRTGVKRNLESMISPEIYINKLGSFKLKDWKLRYTIPSSYAKSKEPDIHERLVEYFSFLNERLIILEQALIDRKNRKIKFKEDVREDSRDIQESEADLGRSS